jgi:hypothetical protein
MIISTKIEVTINSSNMKHFYSLGYKDLKPKHKLLIPIEHLNKGSHSIIKVKCDICEFEKDLSYRFYLKSFNTQEYYCCSKCGKIKANKTSMDKYGVEHFSNLQKVKSTCLKKYGTENPSQVNEFKEKRKKTMLKLYGVEYYVLSNDFSEKSEKTSIVNYGTPHPMMSDKMKELKKEYYIKDGFNITTNEFELYKNKVYNLTKKNKKELLNLWDGIDYYDNEYIKDNFNLSGSHGNYPTIDHKISIFEGFKNNIVAEEISKIENLCFTKRYINSRKYIKTNLTFIR